MKPNSLLIEPQLDGDVKVTVTGQAGPDVFLAPVLPCPPSLTGALSAARPTPSCSPTKRTSATGSQTCCRRRTMPDESADVTDLDEADRAALPRNSKILVAMWEAEDRGDQAEADRLFSALDIPAHTLMALKNMPGGVPAD